MEMDEKEEESKEGIFRPNWQQWFMDKGIVRNTLGFAPAGWNERRASERESSVVSSIASQTSTVVDTQNNHGGTSKIKADVASPLITEADEIRAALVLAHWKRMRNAMLNNESATVPSFY